MRKDFTDLWHKLRWITEKRLRINDTWAPSMQMRRKPVLPKVTLIKASLIF